jgi:hypothetical protein
VSSVSPSSKLSNPKDPGTTFIFAATIYYNNNDIPQIQAIKSYKVNKSFPDKEKLTIKMNFITEI